jgi:hypothetical protein
MSMVLKGLSMPECPVTRTEIAHHIAGAFVPAGARSAELVEHATQSGARPEVVAAIERLPEGMYPSMRDMWKHLDDIPVQLGSS